MSFAGLAAGAVIVAGLVIASDAHGWPVTVSSLVLAALLLGWARSARPPKPMFSIIGALVGTLCSLALGFALVKGDQPSQDGLLIYGVAGLVLGAFVGAYLWIGRSN